MFSTKNAKEEVRSKSQFMMYGVCQATITGYELRESKSGKVQLSLNLESPRITEAGFEAHQDAKMGGQICRVQMGIYFDPKAASSQLDEITTNMAMIADKMGVREQADTIEASSLEEWLNKLVKLFSGKYAWFAITGEEYERTGADRPGVRLGLRRYGFVASLEEGEAHLNPFDKTNTYDYKPLAIPSADPDQGDPIADAFGEADESEDLPWA